MATKQFVAAAFPSDRNVDGIILHPPTLLHVFALAACGNPIVEGGKAGAAHAMGAAVVLWCSAADLEIFFSAGAQQGVGHLVQLQSNMLAKLSAVTQTRISTAASELLLEAYDAFVPTKAEDEGMDAGGMKLDNWGWPLVCAEAAMHEYGMDWHNVLRMPLARLFACRTICDVLRKGRRPTAPSYGERAYIDQIEKGSQ